MKTWQRKQESDLDLQREVTTLNKNDATMEQGKTIVKARGRGGKENFPSVISGAKAEDISRCMANCMMFYDRPIVKSDEECRQRLYDFFDTCQRTGQLPTVEKMVMALGTIKQTVWNWENGIGCSSERMDLIKKAKEFIGGFESEMVTEGKINPVVYIFRAKNYFGMKDQQDLVLTPNNPLGQDIPPEQIAEKYIEALPEAGAED